MGSEKLSRINPCHPEFSSGSMKFSQTCKMLKQVHHDIIVMLFVFLLVLSTGLKSYAQDAVQYVRVGISDTQFKSLLYSENSFVATSEYAVYEKDTAKQIVKLLPSDVLKIKRSQCGFELSSGNKILAKNLNSTLIIDSPKGLVAVSGHLRKGKQAHYHGVFEIIPKDENQFYIVNVLDLQNYLKGVVPNEMPVRFGLEALKAQAVAARNYVLMPRTRAHKEFDVDDSVASQVYFGANTESELSNRAVEETEGLVALYGWELILAQYCSTAGGYTENYEFAFSDPKTKDFPPKGKPYLKGRPDIYSVAPLNREEEARIFYMTSPDSYDMKSPYYRWQKEWGVNDIGKNELNTILQKTLIDQSKTGFVKPEFKEVDILGEIKELNVTRRGVSGKIMELEIVTEGQTYKVLKELVIRRLLPKNGISLPSANVVFDNIYDQNKKLIKVVAYGGGFGHGVGMSQFGAGFMGSSLHKSFDKILKRYYTGISISTCPIILSNHDGQKALIQTFYANETKATLVVDNKFQIQEFNANINGKDVAFQLAPNLIPYTREIRIDISEYLKHGKNTVIFYYPKSKADWANKAIRLHVELFEKDKSEYSF